MERKNYIHPQTKEIAHPTEEELPEFYGWQPLELFIDTLTQRESELEERVRQKNAEIDRLNSELEVHRQKEEHARRYFESAEGKIARLDRLYHARGKRIEGLEKAAETFEMEQKILNKEYSKAVDRAAHLEQAVDNWQHLAEQLESAGRNTQSELEAARLEIQRLKAEAYDLLTAKKQP